MALAPQTKVCATCYDMTSDLESKKWSVISERGCEASSVTHEEARRLVHRLGAEGRHGLCIYQRWSGAEVD